MQCYLVLQHQGFKSIWGTSIELSILEENLMATYLDRSPKKGFVIAFCNSAPATFSTPMSIFSLGRNKKSPPSTLSNPQSSRNLIASRNFPTRSCYSEKKKQWRMSMSTKNKIILFCIVDAWYWMKSVCVFNISKE